jgi:hypothetical protein
VFPLEGSVERWPSSPKAANAYFPHPSYSLFYTEKRMIAYYSEELMSQTHPLREELGKK